MDNLASLGEGPGVPDSGPLRAPVQTDWNMADLELAMAQRIQPVVGEPVSLRSLHLMMGRMWSGWLVREREREKSTKI